jgi:hypothetical protein
MKLNLKSYSPILLSVLILWGLLIVFIALSMGQNQGHFIYAMDDAYIHTAMAKNLSQWGTWGVTKYHFSSTSSSLFWTLVISILYFLGGVSQLTPLVVNFFMATLLLFLIFFLIRKGKYSILSQTFLLIAFIFFIPLPYLILSGMEHILQIFINIAYIYIASRVLESNSLKSEKLFRNLLFLMAPLVVMIRYEGLFIIFAVSVLFLIRKRVRVFIINLFTALVPIILYGLISVLKGWYFLPTSVLLKGRRPDLLNINRILEFVLIGLRQLIYNMHLLILLVGVLALLWLLYKKSRSLWTWPSIMSIIYIFVLINHMFFGESGYFRSRYPLIRYDSYLVALGMLAIVILMGFSAENIVKSHKRELGGKVIKILLGFFFILPLAERGIMTDLKVVRATTNIYQQQFQMGRFLEKYYSGQTVVVNDIGAVSFFADIKCFDVWGLATKGIAALRLNKQYSPSTISQLVKKSGAKIAVVYDQFIRMADVEGDRPRQWEKVGQWRIPHNVVCASNTVSIFSLDKTETINLINNLYEFRLQLAAEKKEFGIQIKRFQPNRSD